MFQRFMSNFNFDLKSQGVLGINARNLDYIFECNRRRFYPLVDNKLETKRLSAEADISHPETYAVIEYQDQVRRFKEIIGNRHDFVIKPAHGSGGSGVLVIVNRVDDEFIKGSGHSCDLGDIEYYLNNVLSGLYSLGGGTDKAIIEYRVKSTGAFAPISYQGVPDVRIIVYKGVPTMAMLRLPTRQSDGKANLHVGGIGVGISIHQGKTTHGTQKGRFIENHPDTRVCLRGIDIPYWDEILYISSQFDKMLGLGYIGVDMVIDETYGPMLLEVNARPGIAIQIANKTGLQGRLHLVDQYIKKLQTVEEKVAFAKENFL